MKDSKQYNYDVCLSFAGENRAYVAGVADELRNKGIRVFYDEYEEVDLWGKDLYEHLDDVYKNAAAYCVIFASKYYANKVWTSHERRSAQERAIRANKEYILPARFDDTPIPGLRETVGYIDLKKKSPATLAGLIQQKIGDRQKESYLPPIPNRLFRKLEARSAKSKASVTGTSHRFLECLKRMSDEERHVLFTAFLNGCPAELPENIHISLDLLRRITEFNSSKIRRIVAGMSALGIETHFRPDKESPLQTKSNEMLVLEWNDRSVHDGGNKTKIACEMIHGAMEGYCEVHGQEALYRLDFSQLADATASEDIHA